MHCEVNMWINQVVLWPCNVKCLSVFYNYFIVFYLFISNRKNHTQNNSFKQNTFQHGRNGAGWSTILLNTFVYNLICFLFCIYPRVYTQCMIWNLIVNIHIFIEWNVCWNVQKKKKKISQHQDRHRKIKRSRMYANNMIQIKSVSILYFIW